MNSPIAVIGPGAIGSTVAALLHAAGHPVLLCGRTARESVEVRPDDHDPIVVPGPVHTDPATVDGPVDVVLLAVKDTQYAQAAGWLSRLCDENTVVCALQNGVEQVERLRPYCPSAAVVPAVIWFSAETQPQGWIWLRTDVRIVLPETDAARTLVRLLSVPGLTVQTDPDYLTEAWRKLLLNAVFGLLVLTGRRAGMFHRDDVAALARDYLVECAAVGRADGADLRDADVDKITGLLAGISPDMGTSILADRQAGRPLEWDIRNGVIRRKAAAHGLPTPISDVVVPLLAAAGDGPG
ncbi:oxidoreductase [Mycobacterium sp. 21AC1]|uniref:oxidoreductase n=1 Tax=[Mycobacterium] appelbergii TaxID=2939269 RepID=UPI00293943DC|nr:oxidoreductase [Mycobacterium sp. 21AC1]MDV3124896.1 oxidoreductase [Mycobacterium sp. 21AC1]